MKLSMSYNFLSRNERIQLFETGRAEDKGLVVHPLKKNQCRLCITLTNTEKKICSLREL